MLRWTLIPFFSLVLACGERSDIMASDASVDDAGTAMPCDDPVTGQGCPSGQRCVWQIYSGPGHRSSDNGACEEVTGSLGNREPCSEASQNCRAGFACLDLVGANQPLCYEVCSLTTRVGCEGSSQTCSARVNDSTNFGVCN